jgi:hypothetical protein
MANAASGRLVCSRCNRPLRTKRASHATGICDGGIALDEPATARACSTRPKLDDWDALQRTRRLGRELRRPTMPASPPFEKMAANPRRFEPPADLFDTPSEMVTPTFVRAPRRSQGGQVIVWLIVMAGTLALCGGIGAIAWCLNTGLGQYWNLSLGLTLGGQGILILGLVLVAIRLWRHSRFATSKLQDVHTRLGQLQRTAEALATNRGGSLAFYADLTRGAPPQVLLSNLKGQIDQLATRLGAR